MKEWLCSIAIMFCQTTPPHGFILTEPDKSMAWQVEYMDGNGEGHTEGLFGTESVCKDFTGWLYAAKVRNHGPDGRLKSAVCKEVRRGFAYDH